MIARGDIDGSGLDDDDFALTGLRHDICSFKLFCPLSRGQILSPQSVFPRNAM
jgi:hypothetical protein